MGTTLPENQQQIADNLHTVIKILESKDIPYVLEGGTLLGAIRENRFLPWDDDVGIAVPVTSDDIFPELSGVIFPV